MQKPREVKQKWDIKKTTIHIIMTLPNWEMINKWILLCL